MNILKKLEKEFQLKNFQVENTVKLIDEGNTIPFIARYRKEMTGSLDDQLLRGLYERLIYLRNLEERKAQIKKAIIEQDKMTDEIEQSIQNAETLTEAEDIYRPFKTKKRTRAAAAKEKGLEPLAEIIWNQFHEKSIEESALEFLNEEKGVVTVEEAISGAKDILAEKISDDAQIRKILRRETYASGIAAVKASAPDKESVYEMYYDYRENVKSIPGHRVLAINRGEKEKILSVKIETEIENALNIMEKRILKNGGKTTKLLKETIEDSYKRLIFPSVEREIRAEMTEKAEEGAIKIFSENLKQLLLQPPVKDKIVLALDPAFRTGCKIAVLDQTGKTLDAAVVYPTPPQNKIEEAKKSLWN